METYRTVAQAGTDAIDWYKWRPIRRGYIRILCLQPGDFGSPLIGTLNRRRLETTRSSHPPYEAISYAWGELVFNHELSIAGGGKIKITTSLSQALQHLRLRDHERRLWADAVCIDQTNKPERAEQVAILASVFASAHRVLVWLGPSEPLDVSAFAIMQCDQVESDVDWPHSTPSALDNRSKQTTYLGKLDLDLRNAPHCGCCGELPMSFEDMVFQGLGAVMLLTQRS